MEIIASGGPIDIRAIKPGNTRRPSIHVSLTRMSEIAVGSTLRGSLLEDGQVRQLAGLEAPDLVLPSDTARPRSA